jgi:predicted DNA-binding mobile mystery protein A
MKNNKKAVILQRHLMDQKFKELKSLPAQPQSGWLKAIRVSLGLSLRQLAKRMKVSLRTVASIEKNEAEGKASLANIERSARAMGCRLTYAVVPGEGKETLENILDERAKAAARKIRNQTAHSMRLEDQEIHVDDKALRESTLAAELKAKADPRLWEEP